MNRELLERVIADLQNEHTRWENRASALATLMLNAIEAGEMAKADSLTGQREGVIAKLDSIELLIRRYRSWLPAP